MDLTGEDLRDSSNDDGLESETTGAESRSASDADQSDAEKLVWQKFFDESEMRRFDPEDTLNRRRKEFGLTVSDSSTLGVDSAVFKAPAADMDGATVAVPTPEALPGAETPAVLPNAIQNQQIDKTELESTGEKPVQVANDTDLTIVDSAKRKAQALIQATRLSRRAHTGLEIHEMIGQGGMGTVFRATQQTLNRIVAVKQHSAPIAGDDGFFSEALVTAYLDHPNIIPVHDLVYTPDRRLLLSMKLVGGRTWAAEIEADRVSESDAKLAPGTLEKHLRIFLQVCQAVSFSHARGILHCDLKPVNIMVGEFGEVYVMDWGVAVDIRSDKELTPESIRTIHASEVTTPRGTPVYMPAELAAAVGDKIGPWTDVYLLGGMLYYLTVGHAPHTGKTLGQVVARALSADYDPIPDFVPAELKQIIQNCLKQQTEQRYSSVKELRLKLEEFLNHSESLVIAARGMNILEQCFQSMSKGELTSEDRARLYGEFNQAASLLQQAYQLWPENESARTGELKTVKAFAQFALANGDLNFAEAQLAKLPVNVRVQLSVAIKTRRQDQALQKRSARRMKFLSIGLAGLVILGAVAFAVYQLSVSKQLQTLQQREQAARVKAQQKLRQVRKIYSENIERVVLDLDNYLGRENLVKSKSLLLDTLSELNGDDAQNQSLLQTAQLSLAEIALVDGDPHQARQHLDKAAQYFGAQIEPKPDHWFIHQYLLSLTLDSSGQFEECQKTSADLIATFRAQKQAPGSVLATSALLKCLFQQAEIDLSNRSFEKARTVIDEAERLLKQAKYALRSPRWRANNELRIVLKRVRLHRLSGEITKAVKLLEQRQDQLNEMLGRGWKGRNTLYLQLYFFQEFTLCLLRLKQFKEAKRYCKAYTNVWTILFDLDFVNHHSAVELTRNIRALAWGYFVEKQAEEAAKLLMFVTWIADKNKDIGHDTDLYRHQIMSARALRGRAMASAGNFDESLPCLKQCYDYYKECTKKSMHQAHLENMLILADTRAAVHFRKNELAKAYRIYEDTDQFLDAHWSKLTFTPRSYILISQYRLNSMALTINVHRYKLAQTTSGRLKKLFEAATHDKVHDYELAKMHARWLHQEGLLLIRQKKPTEARDTLRRAYKNYVALPKTFKLNQATTAKLLARAERIKNRADNIKTD